MTPFEPARMPKDYFDVLNIKEEMQCGTDEAHRIAAQRRREKVFLNDLYQVIIKECVWPDGVAIWHLSIKRRDKEAIHDWRHLQQIKNMLVGTECEAFELYPAESRLVDEANQYHLWAFPDKRVRIPVGSQTRVTATPEEAALAGAKQRPFE